MENRTVGFEAFKAHVLGKDDGKPKTPEWAAEESGIPARKIKALAREWAAKKTVLSAGTRGGEGSACRQAYATEWARLMILLQAMQGLGKPGRAIWGTTMGGPSDTDIYFPGYADPDSRMGISRAADKQMATPTKQRLYRLTLPDAILNPPVSWYGEGFCGPVSGAAVHPLHLPHGGVSGSEDAVPLRQQFYRNHDRHQQMGTNVPESETGIRHQPGLLVGAGKRRLPTLSFRPAPRWSAKTSEKTRQPAATAFTAPTATTTVWWSG